MQVVILIFKIKFINLSKSLIFFNSGTWINIVFFLWKVIGFPTNLYLLALASNLVPSMYSSSKSILSSFFICLYKKRGCKPTLGF